MSSILIAYSSVDGHTKLICQHLQQQFNNNQLNADLIAVETLLSRPPLSHHQYSQIIIGASIRYGKFRPSLYTFIEKNFTVLNATPNAFFSVNLVARKTGKDTPQGSPYTQRFITQSGWHPQHMAVFAGKLNYPQYRFLDRHMIRFIMWITKGPTDLGTVQDFTNWEKVQAFSQDLIRAHPTSCLESGTPLKPHYNSANKIQE